MKGFRKILCLFIIILMFKIVLIPQSVLVSAQSTTNNTAKFNYYNKHIYQLIDESMTWTQAKEYCESLGGHLVTITSQVEQEFVNKLLSSGTKAYYWIGGSQPEGSPEPGGNWRWVTGEAFTYTNWRADQPDNWTGDNSILIIRDIDWLGSVMTGKWSDDIGEGCFPRSSYGFICEWCEWCEWYNTFEYHYDVNSRLYEITLNGIVIIKFEYDENGNLKKTYKP